MSPRAGKVGLAWKKMSPRRKLNRTRQLKKSESGGDCTGTLTGCITANVGDGVAQTTHFFHSERADAIIEAKISPNGGSVVGVGGIV